MPVTSLDLIRVEGQYLLLNGAPGVGTVTFASTVVLVNTTANEVVLPSLYTVNLNALGKFSIDLPATDDPDLSPVGWTYLVTETIAGATNQRTPFNIQIPFNTPVDPATGLRTIDMADVAPAVAVTEVSSYQLVNQKGQPNGYASLDGTGLVPASQLPASSGGGGVTDHGALTGLADDDHPQYRTVATSPSDPVAATAGLRTLGTGAQQALAGNHASTTDQRTPLDGSVTGVKVAAAIKDPAAGVAGLRTLGVGPAQAAAGNRIYPGQIIASTVYAPATQVLFSTTSATPVTLDAVNLSVPFTVPASGVVVVTLDAFLLASGSSFPHWGLTEGGVLVPGSVKRVGHGTLHTAPAYTRRFIGLTPGSVKTWAWAQWSRTSASSMNLYADSGSLDGDLGTAMLEVRAG